MPTLLRTNNADALMPALLALHVVTPPGRNRPARVQALIEYLAASFVREPWALDAEPRA